MIASEAELRDQMVCFCRSLFERGFSVGSAGNVSARLPDGFLMTPTNSALGSLVPDRLSKIDLAGNYVSGDQPTKEAFLHRAFYETRPEAGAVVHLHSTWATALSCLQDIDRDNCIPPLTPYVVMRVGRVKLLSYVKPGDPRAGELIKELNGQFSSVLLANHGPVVTGKDLFSAVCAAEELEETAKLFFVLRGEPTRFLSDEQVAELKTTFKQM